MFPSIHTYIMLALQQIIEADHVYLLSAKSFNLLFQKGMDIDGIYMCSTAYRVLQA